LIIEWAAAIINGVKTYLKEDHEIALFGKILKNECDEEFRFIQMHVKETLSSLLKALLKERFPLKPEVEIQRGLEDIQNDCIEEWQWRRIIEKMYDENDYAILEQRFYGVIEDRRQRNAWKRGGNQSGFNEWDSRKMTREEHFMLQQ
jgi:hypothetical protein